MSRSSIPHRPLAGFLSVALLAASAAEANAVAGALCRAEPGLVRSWMRTRTGLEARYEMPGETGALEILETPGFSALLRPGG